MKKKAKKEFGEAAHIKVRKRKGINLAAARVAPDSLRKNKLQSLLLPRLRPVREFAVRWGQVWNKRDLSSRRILFGFVTGGVYEKVCRKLSGTCCGDDGVWSGGGCLV